MVGGLSFSRSYAIKFWTRLLPIENHCHYLELLRIAIDLNDDRLSDLVEAQLGTIEGTAGWHGKQRRLLPCLSRLFDPPIAKRGARSQTTVAGIGTEDEELDVGRTVRAREVPPTCLFDCAIVLADPSHISIPAGRRILSVCVSSTRQRYYLMIHSPAPPSSKLGLTLIFAQYLLHLRPRYHNL